MRKAFFVVFLSTLLVPLVIFALDTSAPTSLSNSTYYAVGDSIAKSLTDKGLPGSPDNVKDIGPAAVLSIISKIPISIKDYTVVLSSGASNAGCAKDTVSCLRIVNDYVPKQIKALKEKGARVILLGVGTRFSSTDLNVTLQKIAKESGATFSFIKSGKDGVHPDPGSLLSSLKGQTPDATPALKAINQSAIQDVINSCSTTCDTPKIQGALEAFGVPADQAKTLATNHPSDATNLLSALANGDKAQITDATAQANKNNDVQLNQDTLKDISTLTPQQLSKNLSDKSVFTEADQSAVNAINTFAPSRTATPNSKTLPGGKYADTFSQLEQKYNLPAGYLAGVAKVESRGNPSICASTGKNAACGMFQYIPSTWAADSARINGGVPLPPSARFDPIKEAEATAAAAAFYQKKYGNTIANSGMDPNAGLYAIHNLGGAGGPRFINGFVQDPSQSVRNVVASDAIRGNPGLYGDGNISLAQAQQNMLKSMGGNTNFSGGAQSAHVVSPAAAFVTDVQERYYVATGQSPFASVSAVPNNSYNSQGGYGQYNQPQYQNPYQFQNQYNQPQNQSQSQNENQPTYSEANTTNPNNSPSYNQSYTTNPYPVNTQGNQVTTIPPISPIVNILAQPKTVTRGGTITVSWSSVGMSTLSPCTVLQNGVPLVMTNPPLNKNEGTQRIPATVSGTITFTLSCTAQGTAQIVNDTDTVIVQ